MKTENLCSLPTRATGNASRFDAHRGRPVCDPAGTLRLMHKRFGSPRIRRTDAYRSYDFTHNVFDVATITVWNLTA